MPTCSNAGRQNLSQLNSHWQNYAPRPFHYCPRWLSPTDALLSPPQDEELLRIWRSPFPLYMRSCIFEYLDLTNKFWVFSGSPWGSCHKFRNLTLKCGPMGGSCISLFCGSVVCLYWQWKLSVVWWQTRFELGRDFHENCWEQDGDWISHSSNMSRI